MSLIRVAYRASALLGILASALLGFLATGACRGPDDRASSGNAAPLDPNVPLWTLSPSPEWSVSTVVMGGDSTPLFDIVWAGTRDEFDVEFVQRYRIAWHPT